MGDTNGDGFAQLEEFRVGYKMEESEADDGRINDTFFVADTNQDGKLSREEFLALKKVIASPLITPWVHADTNQDTFLNLDEFRAAYKHQDPNVEEDEIIKAFNYGD
jgi:Ca2+-binding EF-hand superfamily protein